MCHTKNAQYTSLKKKTQGTLLFEHPSHSLVEGILCGILKKTFDHLLDEVLFLSFFRFKIISRGCFTGILNCYN